MKMMFGMPAEDQVQQFTIITSTLFVALSFRMTIHYYAMLRCTYTTLSHVLNCFPNQIHFVLFFPEHSFEIAHCSLHSLCTRAENRCVQSLWGMPTGIGLHACVHVLYARHMHVL